MTDPLRSDVPATAQETSGSEDLSEAQSRTAGQSSRSNTFFDRLSGLFRARNANTIREDLADALDEQAVDAADFSSGERAMLRNILRMRELRVDDVMIPRADIEAIDETITLGDLMKRFEELGHSRMPVYGTGLDDPRGMVHIRDIVAYLTRAARTVAPSADAGDAPSDFLDLARVDLGRPIAELGLVRKILFVPPSMHATDLMAQMQAERVQMALVIDEYGGTDGLVSLEDIVEMVVGDIEDEHDDDDALVVKAADGAYLVDAKAEIDDLVAELGPSFSAGEHGENVDTIGGLIFSLLGRVPEKGETLDAIAGYRIDVLDADPRRVKRVRIARDDAPSLERASVA